MELFDRLEELLEKRWRNKENNRSVNGSVVCAQYNCGSLSSVTA
jgi:hypothetical protein